MVGISHCGEGIIMTHRYKIDIKWITFDEVIPEWGKTPQYQADKPHDVTLDKSCLLSDYLPILARPPTHISITLMGSPYAQIGRIKATLSYPK